MSVLKIVVIRLILESCFSVESVAALGRALLRRVTSFILLFMKRRRCF